MTPKNSGNKRVINGQQFPELFADQTLGLLEYCVKFIYFALKLLRVVEALLERANPGIVPPAVVWRPSPRFLYREAP